MELNVGRNELLYCWFHDDYDHPAFECRELWKLSGIESYIWANLRRRCVICGHKEHKICPYQIKLRCAVKGCGENHTTINCLRRKAKVFKEGLDDKTAKRTKILDGLKTMNNSNLIVEGNHEETKLSTNDILEKDLISFDDFDLRTNRNHSSENDQQIFDQCHSSHIIQIKEAKENETYSNTKLDKIISCKTNLSKKAQLLIQKPKSKHNIMFQLEGTKRYMLDKNKSVKHALISKKLSKIINSDKSKGSKNFQMSKKRQQQCHAIYSKSCSKLKSMQTKKQEAIALRLSLNVPILLKKLRRYQAIHKLRHWKFKSKVLRIFYKLN